MKRTSKLFVILAIFVILVFSGRPSRAVELVAFEQTATSSSTGLADTACHYQSFVASTSNFTKIQFWAGSGHNGVVGVANYVTCTATEVPPQNFAFATSSFTTVLNNWTTATFATTSLNIGQTYFLKICHNSAGTMNLYRSSSKVLDTNISNWHYPTTYCGGRFTSDLAFRIYSDIDTSTPPVLGSALNIDISSSTSDIYGNSIGFFGQLYTMVWPIAFAISIAIGFAVMIHRFLNKLLK